MSQGGSRSPWVQAGRQGRAGGTDQEGSGRTGTLEDGKGGTGGMNQGGSSLTRTLEDGQGGAGGIDQASFSPSGGRAEPAAWQAARAAPAGQEAWVAPAGRGEVN